MVDGDKVMAVCALAMKHDGKLSGNAIVATVMSNLGLHEFCRNHGIDLVCTDVGDRHVLEKMIECGYAIGGEQSGHTIFRDYATTGEGRRRCSSARRCMSQACPSRVRLLLRTQYPQELINVAVPHSRQREGRIMARRDRLGCRCASASGARG